MQIFQALGGVRANALPLFQAIFVGACCLSLSACAGAASTDPTLSTLTDTALVDDGNGQDLTAGEASPDAALPPIDIAQDTAGGGDSVGLACKADQDCAPAAPICDPLTKLCVGCLAAGDCSPTQHCLNKACVPFVTCKNSLDCTSATGPSGEPQSICDADLSECVECAGSGDCPPNSDCLAKACVAFTACTNSTDCKVDQVCAPDTLRCVECASAADCGPSQVCEGHACKTFVSCASDKQCTALGMLCDKAKGTCAQCMVDADCPAAYSCQPAGPAATGACTLDVCSAGASNCQSNGMLTCLPNGSGFGAPEPCPAESTCTVTPVGPASSSAKCTPWVCQPGANCSGGKVWVCSADGLLVQSITACNAGQVCVAGACVDAACTPGEAFCQSNVVKLCGDDGLTASVVAACSASQYCEGAACKAMACKPNQSVCTGNAVQTCDAIGAAYLASVDCGSQTCVNGACKSLLCPPATLVCSAGKLATCSPDGLSFTSEKPCDNSTYCGVGATGDAGCLPMACAPSQPVCTGKVAGICKSDGSGTEASGVDCAASGKVCSQGACVSLLCDPAGGPYCDGRAVKSCDSSGMNPTTVATCGAGQFCVKGACANQVCTPNSLQCNGNVATTCDTLGSGLVAGGSDCGSQKCVGGVCKPVVCTAGQTTCAAGVVKTCGGDGTSYAPDKPCEIGTYCGVATSGTASCLPIQCNPGKPACMVQTATLCKIDGSGYENGGVDCSLAGKVCSGGACVSKLCDPQTPLYCNGNVVSKCDATGMNPTAVQTCGAGQYCDKGSCQNQVCAPNTLLCNGNTAVTCNGLGSGFAGAGTDCGSQKCASGACKPLICTPNTAACDGNTLNTCSADGTAIATKKPCGSGFYCGLGAGSVAACLPTVCAPGQPICDGKLATTCKADGSGYVSGGSDCSVSGKVCSAGVCVSGVCNPAFATFCDGNIAKSCDNNGTSSSVLQTCGAGQYCYMGACASQVCAPGSPLCLGSTATVCNSQGSGGAAGGIDCATSSKICKDGACIAGFASCAAILAGNKSAPDGLYPIDPDGPGPLPIVTLFCDMSRGGLTLVGNFFDSASDDMPNSPGFVASGWQQSGNGSWDSFVVTIDRMVGGTLGSAAIGLNFASALAKSAGQSRLRFCFVDKWGTDTTCRDTYDGSLVPASYSGGNSALAAYASDKLTYTFARLAGAAGKANSYDPALFGNGSSAAAGYCIGRAVGSESEFGTVDVPGLCDSPGAPIAGVWFGAGGGMAYAPYKVSNDELASPAGASTNMSTFGFRLYLAQNPLCGNAIKETGEGCDDGNSVTGDGCTSCQLEPPKAQIGDILITEVMARPTTVSDEWVEVLNIANHPIDLNGLYLSDDAFYFKLARPNGFFLKAGEYALIAAVDLAKYEGAAAPDLIYGYTSAGIAFANSGDVVCLSLDIGCTPAARLGYVAFGAQAQSASYQLSSLTLSAAGAAIATNWCAGKVAYGTDANKGTPKVVNSTCP